VGHPTDWTTKRTLELSTGITMAYVEAGDPRGEPVILLHGLTDTSRSFFPMMEHLVALDPGLRILAPDQRGHGASSMPSPERCRAAPEECFRPVDFASDVIAFMDALRIQKAPVVGHSMSGVIAQEIALTSPERVGRLVLLDTWASSRDHPTFKDFLLTGLLEGPWREALVAQGRAFPDDVYELAPVDIPDAKRWLAANWVADPVADPDFLAAVLPETIHTRLGTWIGVSRALNTVDNRERLARLAVPTLMIWATQDNMSFESDQAILRAALDSAARACSTEYFWKAYGQATLPASGLQETDIGHNVHWGAAAGVAADVFAFLREGRPTRDLFFADPEDVRRVQRVAGGARIVEGGGENRP
jgi:pimeloyl-ACP methyl ester carboxylesterase